VNNKLTISIALLIIVASIFAYYYFDDVIQVGRVLMVIAGVVLAGFVASQCEAGKEAWVFAKGAAKSSLADTKRSHDGNGHGDDSGYYYWIVYCAGG